MAANATFCQTDITPDSGDNQQHARKCGNLLSTEIGFNHSIERKDHQEKMAVQFNRAVYKMILLVSFFAIIQHTADADVKQVKIIFNPDFT